MKRYHLLKDNTPRGPYSFDDLIMLNRRGDISGFDKIREDGSEGWVDAFKLLGALSRADEDPPVSNTSTSAGVIAGVASFFVPGLGQVVQGRIFMGIFYFGFAFFLWFILLGWIAHLASAYEAATYKEQR